jgi:hypothetical protein
MKACKPRQAAGFRVSDRRDRAFCQCVRLHDPEPDRACVCIAAIIVRIPALFPRSGMFIHRRAPAPRCITPVARDKAAQLEAADKLDVTPHPAHVSILA